MSENQNNYENNSRGENKDVFADVYKEVMELKSKSRGWSVASLVLGIISIICCCIPLIGILSGVLSIIFSVISRITLGYFDGLSIAGLITSIFGIMFGVFTIVGEYLFLYSAEFAEYRELYFKLLEEEAADAVRWIKSLF